MKVSKVSYIVVVAALALSACKEDGSVDVAESSNSNNKNEHLILAAGINRTCALNKHGQVKCWGNNNSGALGLGDLAHRGDDPGEMGLGLSTVDLGTGMKAAAIAVAWEHVCALLNNGQVKCWGDNVHGNMGVGDTVDRGDDPGEMGDNLSTVDLGTGRIAIAISAGGDHTCAILDNQKVKCWGYNNDGELGLEDSSDRGDLPGEMGDNLPYANLGTGLTVKAIAAATHGTCAIMNNNKVKCWGHNSEGTLGLGDSIGRGHLSGQLGDNLPYVDLGTGRTVKAITGGDFHFCAILDNNMLKCWGRNHRGQLGLGDTNNRGDNPGEMGDNLPTVDLGGLTVKAVHASYDSTCAILSDDSLKCWGGNSNGQLGLEDVTNRGDAPNQMGSNLPALALGTGVEAKRVSVGQNHACAVMKDKTVKCWGSGYQGLLGQGDQNTYGHGANTMGDLLPIVDLSF